MCLNKKRSKTRRELWRWRGLYCRDCVVGCVLRSSVRQAAAAITRCAQLCVQVRGLHLLNGTESESEGKEKIESGGGGQRERERRVQIKSSVFDWVEKWEIITKFLSVLSAFKCAKAILVTKGIHYMVKRLKRNSTNGIFGYKRWTLKPEDECISKVQSVPESRLALRTI